MRDALSIEASLSGSIQVLVETVALQRARAAKAEGTLARIREIANGSIYNTPHQDYLAMVAILEVFEEADR